jgi:hypothetical protein
MIEISIMRRWVCYSTMGAFEQTMARLKTKCVKAHGE